MKRIKVSKMAKQREKEGRKNNKEERLESR